MAAHKGSNEIPSNCQVSESKLTDTWIRMAENEWIYSIHLDEQIRLICEHGINTKKVTGEGIMHLAPGCRMHHNNIELMATAILNTNLSISFIPQINITAMWARSWRANESEPQRAETAAHIQHVIQTIAAQKATG